MAREIWVNIGSGNGLLPDGTKPLPEPMLTDHVKSSDIDIKVISQEMPQPSITKICLKITYLKFLQIPRGQWVNSLGLWKSIYPTHLLPECCLSGANLPCCVNCAVSIVHFHCIFPVSINWLCYRYPKGRDVPQMYWIYTHRYCQALPYIP